MGDAFGASGVIITGHAADVYDPKALRASTGSLHEACDRLVRIPMSGSASSLNAATAAAVVLYESARQRAAARP